VTATEAIQLLEKFRAGGAGRDEVLRAFQAAPIADLGFAQVDTHRALRKGFPEVIFGAGKTPAQVVKIAAKLLEREQRILVTRITGDHAPSSVQRKKSSLVETGFVALWYPAMSLPNVETPKSPTPTPIGTTVGSPSSSSKSVRWSPAQKTSARAAVPSQPERTNDRRST